MKSLRRTFAALLLTLTFCCPAFAGIMHTGLTSNCAPDPASLALEAVFSVVQSIIAVA